jgi:hypothetical protein
MVSYAVTVARTSPERAPARIRIPSYAVWETVVLVLNILAFIFIGLHIRPIQGLTLKPLLRALDLRDDDPVGREWNVAREHALRAGVEILDCDQSPAAEAVRQEFAANLGRPPPIVKADGPGTARFITPPFRQLTRAFSNSGEQRDWR